MLKVRAWRDVAERYIFGLKIERLDIGEPRSFESLPAKRGCGYDAHSFRHLTPVRSRHGEGSPPSLLTP
jgi:hypothetical protein